MTKVAKICGHKLSKSKLPALMRLVDKPSFCQECLIKQSVVCDVCKTQIYPGQLLKIELRASIYSIDTVATPTCLLCCRHTIHNLSDDQDQSEIIYGYLSMSITNISLFCDGGGYYYRTNGDEHPIYINTNLSDKIEQYVGCNKQQAPDHAILSVVQKYLENHEIVTTHIQTAKGRYIPNQYLYVNRRPDKYTNMIIIHIDDMTSVYRLAAGRSQVAATFDPADPNYFMNIIEVIK